MNYRERGRFFSGSRPLWAGAALLCLAALAALVFVCRRPVILVSDRPFEQLYGENRARWKRLCLSFRLFRPVRIALAAEGAGPDLIARAVLDCSRRPRALFFPWRYREAVRRCLGEQPGTAAVVLGGRNLPPVDGGAPQGALWFCTDTALDRLRAEAMAERSGGKLVDGAFRSDPQGESALPEGDSPLILFTWADPALLPRRVIAVFDDSPLAQLEPAFKLLKNGASRPFPEEGALIPSEITVYRRDRGQEINYYEIIKLKTLKKEAENADN